MTLTVRDPWRMLDQWRREMDRMTAGDSDGTHVEGSNWSPAVDIKEEDDRFVIHADVPGVKPGDMEVSMDKGVLTLRGERRHESQDSEQGFHRLERSHGVFVRRFALPETVDPEGIQASSKDGVLELVLPKQPEPTPRRIEVRS